MEGRQWHSLRIPVPLKVFLPLDLIQRADSPGFLSAFLNGGC